MRSTGFCIFCHYARRRDPCHHAGAAFPPDTAPDTGPAPPPDIGAAPDHTGGAGTTRDIEATATH